MIEAYDYDRQCWVTGPEARALLRQQLAEERALLVGPRGQEYLTFSAPGEDMGRVLAAIDVRLAELG
jgi:hypothetical protein